jgi:hypothetical protein
MLLKMTTLNKISPTATHRMEITTNFFGLFTVESNNGSDAVSSGQTF